MKHSSITLFFCRSSEKRKTLKSFWYLSRSPSVSQANNRIFIIRNIIVTWENSAECVYFWLNQYQFGHGYDSIVHEIVHNYYYISDSLWKIWLVESIQSFHNSLWTWYDKCNICWILHLSCQVQHAWLLSPLKCSQKQKGWMLRFCFWGWIMWKMYNTTNIEFGFRMICHVCVICPSLQLWQITQTSVLIIHDIMLNLIQ